MGDLEAQPCTECAALQCIAVVAELVEPRFCRRCNAVHLSFTARHTTTHRAGHGLPTWWTFPSPA